MREMKDSGVRWIGEIPTEWDSIKLKYVFGYGDNGLKIGPFGSAMKGKTLENGPVKIYNQAHLIQNDFSLNRHFVSEETYEELKSYEVKPGDILFSMMGTIGKCQIMPEGYPKGIMDSHLLKAGLNKKIIARFLLYAYDKDFSEQVIQQLLYVSDGTIMNGLNSSILKNVYIALPKIDEQKKIVDYLDSKCAKIDSIIEKQQAIIEKLKEYKLSVITEAVTKGLNLDVEMKDSGIERIGKIPTNWSVVKGHRIICATQNGLTRRDLDKSDGQIVLKLKNISEEGYIDYTEVNRIELSNTEQENYKLKENDFLFVRVNGSRSLVGKSAIFHNIGEVVAYNDHIIRVTLESICDPNYFRWYLQSVVGKREIDMHINTAAGQYTISGDGLRDLTVVLPPKEIQVDICYRLNCLAEKCDKTIRTKEKIIQKLSEYKKSLIYEVVTGKKEV